MITTTLAPLSFSVTSFPTMNDFDFLGFEGEIQGGGLPWGWLINDPKNTGLAFKAGPDDDQADLAGVKGKGEMITYEVTDENSGESVSMPCVLFRRPSMVILREVKVAEWVIRTALGRQTVRVFDNPSRVIPQKTDDNKLTFKKKVVCVLIDQEGGFASSPFSITLKGVSKMTWNLSVWGPPKDSQPLDLLSPKWLGIPQIETDLPGYDYFGGQSRSKGLFVEKGVRKVGLERLQAFMNQPKWFPTPASLPLFNARMIFRPQISRIVVGTSPDKRKPAVLFVGFHVPTIENTPMGFVPKAKLGELQQMLDIADGWASGLERFPKAPVAPEVLDCTNWGEQWLPEETPAPTTSPGPAWGGGSDLF